MLDVVVPCLANKTHCLGAGSEQALHLRIVLHLHACFAGCAKRNKLGRCKVKLGCCTRKELVLLGVRAWPAPLDVGNTKVV